MTQLAINGGPRAVTEDFHPWPHHDENELRLVEEVIRSRKWFSGMRGSDPGTKTEKFQEEFARFHGTRFGIACANGTVAIEISLRAAGVGVGDEVIIPGLTFIATLSAVLQVNAIPIVVDVDYETQCIDPNAIEEHITERTRAVIPVHFGGFVCDMDRIRSICRKHDLVCIEDAAHAHGAIYQSGDRVGTLGDLATFSFQESKTMTAGEGGMIVTDDPELAEACVMFRSCGRKKGRSWYEHFDMPINYRLTEMQSAVLLAQLSRLEDQLQVKNENARFFNEQLESVPGLEPVPGNSKTRLNGYYLYLLRYDREKFGGLSRDRFVEALAAEGVPAHIGYPWPLTQNPMFREEKEGAAGCPLTCPYYEGETSIGSTSLPVSERICEETVVLPHQLLLSTRNQLLQVIEAVRKIQGNLPELMG